MTVAVGDRLPTVTLRRKGPDGAETFSTDEVFRGKTVILIGMPGAFTPTCSNAHLPGYVENADAFKARGVDEIAVLAVNDHHVMSAWAEQSGARGRVTFLADGNGEFTRAAGLDADMSGGGMGVRSRRYSLLAEDGVVRALNIEEGRGAEASGAARMLDLLASAKPA